MDDDELSRIPPPPAHRTMSVWLGTSWGSYQDWVWQELKRNAPLITEEQRKQAMLDNPTEGKRDHYGIAKKGSRKRNTVTR